MTLATRSLTVAYFCPASAVNHSGSARPAVQSNSGNAGRFISADRFTLERAGIKEMRAAETARGALGLSMTGSINFTPPDRHWSCFGTNDIRGQRCRLREKKHYGVGRAPAALGRSSLFLTTIPPMHGLIEKWRFAGFRPSAHQLANARVRSSTCMRKILKFVGPHDMGRSPLAAHSIQYATLVRPPTLVQSPIGVHLRQSDVWRQSFHSRGTRSKTENTAGKLPDTQGLLPK